MDTLEPVGEPLDTSVEFRLVVVEDVQFALNQPSPVVVLREIEGVRWLRLPVALPDAQALFAALHGQPGRRPSSSELAATVLSAVGVDLIAVRIVRCDAGVFFAELDLQTPRGRRVFDCRPSDAFGIGLRHPSGAPFLVAEDILRELGTADSVEAD